MRKLKDGIVIEGKIGIESHMIIARNIKSGEYAIYDKDGTGLLYFEFDKDIEYLEHHKGETVRWVKEEDILGGLSEERGGVKRTFKKTILFLIGDKAYTSVFEFTKAELNEIHADINGGKPFIKINDTLSLRNEDIVSISEYGYLQQLVKDGE